MENWLAISSLPPSVVVVFADMENSKHLLLAYQRLLQQPTYSHSPRLLFIGSDGWTFPSPLDHVGFSLK